MIVVVARFRGNPLRKSRRAVEENAWIGQSEIALRKLLGEPTRVVPRYDAVGLKGPSASGPYRTLVYEHPDGFLYVWLNDPGGGFVCFESLWFNRDVQF